MVLHLLEAAVVYELDKMQYMVEEYPIIIQLILYFFKIHWRYLAKFRQRVWYLEICLRITSYK